MRNGSMDIESLLWSFLHEKYGNIGDIAIIHEVLEWVRPLEHAYSSQNFEYYADYQEYSGTQEV